MNKNFINLKDQETLYIIQEYLKHISVESTLLEAGSEIPNNILIAITAGRASINMMYVPVPEDHFEEIRLFQLFSLLVAEVRSELKNDLAILLNELNSRSPLGSFSINAKGELGFKYIFPVARFGIPEEKTFLDIVSLYLDCLENFSKLVTDVNIGSLSLEKALGMLTSADSES